MVAVLALAALQGLYFPSAHAHNDYLHPRPLLDALEQGFGSIEADIFLEEGELRVGHDRSQLRPGRTLESLYLGPLKRLTPEWPPGRRLMLLVDVKADGEAVYRRLRQVLPRYRQMLTEYAAGSVRPRAVTVVISGDRPRDSLLADSNRFAFFDGRVADLGKGYPSSFMPLISDSWWSHFTWRGEGEMPPEERSKLRELVRRSHARGHRLRFWAHPDVPSVWATLRDVGVDLINSDRLEPLRRFLSDAATRSSSTSNGAP